MTLITERATEPDATTGKCSATLYALALSPLTGEAGGLGRFVPKSRQNPSPWRTWRSRTWKWDRKADSHEAVTDLRHRHHRGGRFRAEARDHHPRHRGHEADACGFPGLARSKPTRRIFTGRNGKSSARNASEAAANRPERSALVTALQPEIPYYSKSGCLGGPSFGVAQSRIAPHHPLHHYDW